MNSHKTLKRRHIALALLLTLPVTAAWPAVSWSGDRARGIHHSRCGARLTSDLRAAAKATGTCAASSARRC